MDQLQDAAVVVRMLSCKRMYRSQCSPYASCIHRCIHVVEMGNVDMSEYPVGTTCLWSTSQFISQLICSTYLHREKCKRSLPCVRFLTLS